MEKLKNWWAGKKMYLIIALVALVAFGLFRTRGGEKTPSDYHVAVVCAEPLTNDELEMIESSLYCMAEDTTGDSKLMISLHNYWVDAENPKSGSRAETKLRAELEEGLCGVYILDKPEALGEEWAGVLEADFVPFGDGLYIAARLDSDGSCARLRDSYR